MSHQRGFALYAALGALLVIAGLTIALRVQTSRLEAVKQEYARFQAQVKALGEVAEAKAKAKEKADKELKARIDHEHKNAIANLRAESQRLRDKYAGRGVLPPAPADSPSPDRITFDRAELNGALQQFIESVGAIVEEGAAAVIDLETARAWASQVK